MFITILFLDENPHGIKILVIPKKGYKGDCALGTFFSLCTGMEGRGSGGSPKNDMNHE